jgi:molybdate transport system ATP-binding protein
VTELSATIEVKRGDFQLAVELACPPGITCVMGPSGSGKSTILQVLAGLMKPDRGRVCLGADCWLDVGKGIDVPVYMRRMAYVFQSLALFPHLNALHNVAYGMDGMPREQKALEAKKLLDRVGVGHLAKRRPRTFSGGEAQRVALARALARQPRVLFLDEPFSALDRDLRAQLTKLVRELVAELGVPLVHVTHSVAEARLLADQVVRVEKGRVVSKGTAAEVLASITSVED